jgi:DNA-binding FadR family transcriptional regulator
MIVAGEIEPGEPLPSEMQICESMAVSRTAVREALRLLAGKGLIEARPKSGTRVRPLRQWNFIDPDVLSWHLAAQSVSGFLAKLSQLRFAVDPPAAALAAEHRADADVAALGSALAGMADPASDEAFVEADLAFHRAIYTATGNEFFLPLWGVFEIGFAERFRIGNRRGHRAKAVQLHRILHDAILAQDVDGARSAALHLLLQSDQDMQAMKLDGAEKRAAGESRPWASPGPSVGRSRRPAQRRAMVEAPSQPSTDQVRKA